MQLCSPTELMCPILVPIWQDAVPPFSPLLLHAKAARLWRRAMGWGGRSGPHMWWQYVAYVGCLPSALSLALIAETSAHGRAVGQP